MSINYYPGSSDINAGFVDINENEWYHLAGVWDGSELIMYINGKQAGSKASLNSLALGDDPNFQVGRAYSNNRYVNDEFNSIRVYRKGLTANEIAQNFYGGPISINNIEHTWDAGNIASYTEDVLVKDISGTINGNMIANSRVEKYGGYWRFTGDDNWILLDGSTDSFRLNQGDNWTVNTWIRTGVSGGAIGDQPIMSNSQSGPVWSNFKVHENKMGYSHYNNAWIVTTGNTVITDNQWHMLTWVNKGDGTMDMYVDGALDAQGVDSRLSSANRIDIIGSSWGGRFNGDIAMVQVNRASLTQEEVLQNYNAHVTRFK